MQFAGPVPFVERGVDRVGQALLEFFAAVFLRRARRSMTRCNTPSGSWSAAMRSIMSGMVAGWPSASRRANPCCCHISSWSLRLRSSRNLDRSAHHEPLARRPVAGGPTTSVTVSLRTSPPETGLNVRPMRAHSNLRWSWTSVTVPTVERLLREATFCSTAMAGVRLSMRSTSGFSSRPANWRT